MKKGFLALNIGPESDDLSVYEHNTFLLFWDFLIFSHKYISYQKHSENLWEIIISLFVILWDS